MEADRLHGLDRSLSLYKSQIRNPKKIHKPYEVFPPADHASNPMGFLKAPPLSLTHSNGQQPPLLPLPASHLRRSTSILGPSYCPPNRNMVNGIRHHSFTLKKSTQSPTKIPKKEEKKIPKRSSYAVNVSPSSSGPLRSVGDHEDVLLGSSLFTISPPPSSLPLPTFSLRPKLSCNAVAAGVDNGATDNLRRLLRLQ